MATLRNGQWKAPFWGVQKTFITGQDMLGMQNTSIATYGVLVPGLTNLTRRIRYYGFYVWVLERYAEQVGTVSVSKFQQHVRRAELLLAYIMADQFPSTKGIVGSQFAKKTLEEYPVEIDLAKGVDKEKGKKTYWKYSSGAFGQYYQGALIALRLIAPIEAHQRIFAATPELGRKLCACFEESIAEEKRELYFNTVKKGRITRKELKELAAEFSVNHIPANSSEQAFYRSLILGPDFPEKGSDQKFFRRDTILLYLSFLKESERFSGHTKFWNTFYTSAWDGHALESCSSEKGWLYYCINENTHYCLETFLWHLLIRLEAEGGLVLQDALVQLRREIIAELEKLNIIADIDSQTFEKVAVEIHAKGYEPFDEVASIEEEGKKHIERASAKAFLALCRIHVHIQNSIKVLADYSRFYRMDREGDCLAFFIWMERHQELKVGEFLERLFLNKIINRHLEVAMRKMRNRDENTLKFIFEDNQLKFISIISPVLTTPRIPSLRLFLEDLGYVKESGELTRDGFAVLEGKLNE